MYGITNIIPRKTRKGKIKTEISESLMFQRLSNIAMNNIKWNNLPEELNSYLIERALFATGVCGFGYDDKIGFIALPATSTGELNIYNEPISWQVIGNAFSKSFDNENSVFIRNNINRTAGVMDCVYYVEKIVNVERTIDTHVELLKMPYIVKTNDKKLMSMKNILNQKENHEIAIFASDAIDTNNFSVFQGLTDFLIDDLYKYKKSLIGEYLELLGFETANVEKRERLLVDEVNANDEITKNGYINVMLEMREKACLEINRIFGLNVSVELNREIEKEVIENELSEQLP